MLPPVFTTLKSSTDVKNIVGTNPPRIYRHGSAPQDTTKPYITWQVIADTPENQLSGTPPTDRAMVQVNCWYPPGPTGDAGVVLMAEAVRDAIEPYAYMTGIVVDQQEPETRLFWMAMQFDWFVDR